MSEITYSKVNHITIKDERIKLKTTEESLFKNTTKGYKFIAGNSPKDFAVMDNHGGITYYKEGQLEEKLTSGSKLKKKLTLLII